MGTERRTERSEGAGQRIDGRMQAGRVQGGSRREAQLPACRPQTGPASCGLGPEQSSVTTSPWGLGGGQGIWS